MPHKLLYENLFQRRYSTTSEERKRLSRIDENLIIQNHLDDQQTESQLKDSGEFLSIFWRCFKVCSRLTITYFQHGVKSIWVIQFTFLPRLLT